MSKEADALEALADIIAERVAEKIIDKIGDRDRGDDLVDQNCGVVPKSVFLRAANRDEFPYRRLGKRVLAKRVDLLAWIDSKNVARLTKPAKAKPADDIEEVLSMGGLKVG